MPVPGAHIAAAEEETPVPLRPYISFGVPLDLKGGEKEAIGDCPFCSREGKLYVNSETGQFHCKVCGESGNVYSFLRRVWEESKFDQGEAEKLSENRLISPATFDAWGLRPSFISGEWLVPGYDAAGKLNQLYRRIFNYKEQRWYLNGPKGINHQLHGVPLFDRGKRDVYLCEGIWDAMILWELLRQIKIDDEDGSFSFTSNQSISMLRDANVIATPACTVFSEYWLSLFAGKRVFICFDNDHPAKQTGKSGAFEGIKRVSQLLAQSNDPPESIHYLDWADGSTESGEHWNLELKHGYDLRDLLTGHEERQDAAEAVGWLIDHMRPVKPEWLKGADGKKGKPIVETLPCDKWESLVAACGKALHFHEGMDLGLSVMLAAGASVDVGMDQLWVKFIGPASSGKTTLADGLLIDRKHATLKSIISGLHSGYKGPENADGVSEDFSLMAQIKGKAVIIKDGDTLMSAENVGKTLADLRDAYDRKSSTFFKNGVANDYEDHPFVMLVYGTNALRKLDQSELGCRFIDCVVLDGIEDGMEDKIAKHKRRQRIAIMGNQATANGDRIEGPEMLTMKRMIGGYLKYLRDNIKVLLAGVKESDEAGDAIEAYAKMVAMFRARPSAVQNESQSRELSARLIDQLGKLAYCLAVVLNKTEIDKEVLRRVKQCAFDTARGKTLQIATQLYKSGKNGLNSTSLSQRVNAEAREVRKLLIFMRDIGIIETHTEKASVGLGSSAIKWRLTPNVRKLYASINK